MAPWDVTAPATGISGEPTGSGAPAAHPSPPGAAGAPLGSPAAVADRVDIHGLDTAAALQILLTEVRAELDLTLLANAPQSPAQAARTLIALLADAPPDATAGLESGAAIAGGAAAPGAAVEASLVPAVLAALDRAMATITAWRNVPAEVVDAAKETQALVTATLTDDARTTPGFRPEWLGLLLPLQTLWRRRRRRVLTDPDGRPRTAGLPAEPEGADAKTAVADERAPPYPDDG